ncbi:MAG TPA: multidrug efflux RND transporter permease subunit [Vicinamibacterales bacterium]|nr:multidrug efflux RND transporter permease subunit [Vicinamibacterales bacterium]
MSNFFIRRPIVAMVISILMVIVGAVAASRLPVEQYPGLAPPTIKVTTRYPGANAEIVEQSVATPIEQQMNGVDNMLYLKSLNTSDGQLQMDVTFRVGMDRDMANVLAQNRVGWASSRLPIEVTQQGVIVKKVNPSILMLVSVYSPTGAYDGTFLNNFAVLNLRDAILRVPGVAQADLIGGSEYGMRVWVRPDRLAQLGLSATDVVNAIKEQNLQAPAGQIGGEPAPRGQEFTYTVRAPGRFTTPEEFANIIVRSAGEGGEVRIRDVGRVELGNEFYGTDARLNGQPAAVLQVFLLPGANQVQSAEQIYHVLEEQKARFPDGIDYKITYDTTPAVEASIHEVMKTLYEAVFLVILVVFIFLQSWRATLIPLLTVPVSLVGALIFFPMLGFTINVLTLFGLVLAIGIVVDDAIVVVEAVMHHIEHGMSPKDATVQAMKEVSAPVIGIAFILSAVFIPVAFVGGLTGQLYMQFAITIALSVLISAFNALTLSPALAALLLKPGGQAPKGPLGKFFGAFNRGFEKVTGKYVGLAGGLVRKSIFAILAVVAFAVGAGGVAKFLPGGFVPDEDLGIFLVHLQLPSAASLQRTGEVARQVEAAIAEEEMVDSYNTMLGTNFLSLANTPYVATFAVRLKPWEERPGAEGDVLAITRRLQQRLQGLSEAVIFPYTPPTIPGFGAAGGFMMVVQDRSGQMSIADLGQRAREYIAAARQRPEIAGVTTTFDPTVPQVAVDVNREQARSQGVAINDVFMTLQTALGGVYVNDFNRFGRVYRVYVQADSGFRRSAQNINDFFVRSQTTRQMVPLGALVTARNASGAEEVTRYNLFRSVVLNGSPAPGYSSGQAMQALREVAAATLPAEMGIEWSGFSYQEATAPPALPTFVMAIVFVFLLLAAMYESWSLPFSVLLGTPLAAFGAFVGLWIAGYELNVFTQIGLITLIGLAAKNAILIVEFAKMKREEGMPVMEAALTSAKLRFRPILMTSFAFILGVVPLMLASGSGSNGQNVMGVSVFAGMLAATALGVFLIPGLYAFVQGLAERLGGAPKAAEAAPAAPAAAKGH